MDTDSIVTQHPTIQCAACGRRADIWHEEETPLCGRCYLIAIGEEVAE